MIDAAPRLGRPRSEHAREAVLQAVDDLLIEVGYAAMTMKGIAERAGVGRQTVYRWWSTKAEILLEAGAADAAEELTVDAAGSPVEVLAGWLDALLVFLVRSPAGAGYRALLAAAQHDPAVAALVAGNDPVAANARIVLDAVAPGSTDERTVAVLVGPVLYWVLGARDPDAFDTTDLARRVLAAA